MCRMVEKEEKVMNKRVLAGGLVIALAISMLGCKKETKKTDSGVKPTLTLIGHASTKIKTAEGTVIYIDPFAEGDYEEEADIVLVTHQHDDHNKVSLIKKKDDTEVITNEEALVDDVYNSFDVDGVKIEAVPAENSNHPRSQCVGYVISFDDISVYHAGDTSFVDEMKDMQSKNITYAMYPIDGVYNMDAEEATKCADTVGAKHNIAMHTDFYAYNEDKVKNFTPEGKLEVPYGTTIELEKE